MLQQLLQWKSNIREHKTSLLNSMTRGSINPIPLFKVSTRMFVLDSVGSVAVAVTAVLLLGIIFRILRSILVIAPDNSVVVVNLLRGVRRELGTGIHIMWPFVEQPTEFMWSSRQTVRGVNQIVTTKGRIGLLTCHWHILTRPALSTLCRDPYKSARSRV